MVTEAPILVALLGLIDRIPVPTPTNRRGRPKTYSDRLFLKALVIMIVRHLPKVHSLLAVLEEPEIEIEQLHEKLDMLREKQWNELVEMQQRQITLLEQQLEAVRGLKKA